MNHEHLDRMVERLLALGTGDGAGRFQAGLGRSAEAERLSSPGRSAEAERLSSPGRSAEAERLSAAEFDMARMLDTLARAGNPDGLLDGLLMVAAPAEPVADEAAGRLSFDELYAYHFGGLSERQRREVEAVLATDPASRQFDRLFEGLPDQAEAERVAAADRGALPADLKRQVLSAAGVGRRAGVLARLGRAAREVMERVRDSADRFVVMIGSAVTEVVRVSRAEPAEASESAFAYDAYTATNPTTVPGTAAGTMPSDPDSSRVPGQASPVIGTGPVSVDADSSGRIPRPTVGDLPATAGLPRIRVEHGWLCMALAGEQSQRADEHVDVALVDAAGREVAVSQANHIGVVMFKDILPGTYGLRIRRPA